MCVSRTSFSWGIPVKSDPKHVVYVWLDALTNYITGLGYDANGNSGELYKKYWPADVHIIGKDIVRFHTIYWPIFLMALGEPLPKQIYGHPWLLQDGGKMSKSKGNVIYADDLVDVFGVDPVRYFLLAQMPFDNDGQISWESVCETVNSELANVYGNLVKRTLAMNNKYFGGIVEKKGIKGEPDDDLIAQAKGTYAKVAAKIDGYKVADALEDIINLFRRANKYIDETAPWVLAKDENNKDRLATVLYNLTETIIIGSSMMTCFMPTLAEKVLEQCGSACRDFSDLDKFGLLASGTKTAENPQTLFERVDVKEVTEKVNKMYEERKAASEKPAKAEQKEEEKVPEEITIDDFAKVQLKVGRVLECRKVGKADKLLCSTIDLGEEKPRTIVSGIAKWYKPEEMVGKQVVVVANLKPVKLRGILSEGMVLCAEDKDGNLSLVAPESVMAAGSEIR